MRHTPGLDGFFHQIIRVHRMAFYALLLCKAPMRFNDMPFRNTSFPFQAVDILSKQLQ